jgi:hypothetical protein
MEAFTLGYRSDSLNASDAEAIQWYVRNETGGRLDRTLNEMCTAFDQTCMTTRLSTLPPLTSTPLQPSLTNDYVIGALVSGTALVALVTTAYLMVRKFCPTRSQLAERDTELLPLRN